MSITHRIQRAQERKKQKEDAKLIKQLQLSDFTYIADDKNMTFSAMGSQLIDFMRVIGIFERSCSYREKGVSLYLG